MSRDYGRVYGTFWSSKTTASMTDDGKLLSLYLMTCTHNTIAGVFRLPDGYVAEDTGWDAERVAQVLRELFRKGFAVRCEVTKWVWVCKHLEWNKPENPNQRKAAAKVALSVPDECTWKRQFLVACADPLGIEPPTANPSGNPFETVAEPFRNQEQEQEQEQEILPAAAGGPLFEDEPPSEAVKAKLAVVRTPSRFEDFWAMWPRSQRKQDRKACADKWARKRLDAEADAILADLAAQKRSRQWLDGFEPAPLTYLNRERWRDGVDSQAAASVEDERFAGAL
jgi:hypothetical protein